MLYNIGVYDGDDEWEPTWLCRNAPAAHALVKARSAVACGYEPCLIEIQEIDESPNGRHFEMADLEAVVPELLRQPSRKPRAKPVTRVGPAKQATLFDVEDP